MPLNNSLHLTRNAVQSRYRSIAWQNGERVIISLADELEAVGRRESIRKARAHEHAP